MTNLSGLIPIEAFNDLPEGADAVFVKLCDAALNAYAKENEKLDGTARAHLRSRCIREIRALASELNVGEIALPQALITESGWSNFLGEIAGIKARAGVRRRSIQPVDSIPIGRITKHRLLLELEILQRMVREAEIEEWRRDSLLDLVTDLISELHRDRVTFRKVITLAAAIAGLVGGTASLLANGEAAKESVLKILEAVGGEADAQAAVTPALAADKKPPALVDYSNASDQKGEQ